MGKTKDYITWVTLDDRFFDCEKVQELLSLSGGRAALLLHFAALTHCGRHLTDGVLSPTAVRMAGTHARVLPSGAELLVSVRLWERNGEGFVIHDYLDYNRSRAEVEALQAQKRAAGQAGGKASAEAKRKQVLKQSASKVQAKSTQRSEIRDQSTETLVSS